MCGICGFTGELENREDVLRKMTEAITHRGPDSDGFYTDDYISMGFRRLSIIDLETGDQPITNEDGTKTTNQTGWFCVTNFRLLYLGEATPEEAAADVIDALRRVRPSVLRFPGGCFASLHDWRNAIGPRNQRKPENS